ncbi:MAG TPA: hypothetical protein DEF42_03635 [Desulfosporosinus sp.]|nr:hypothetical protein [Desulfosporosinus sp.]
MNAVYDLFTNQIKGVNRDPFPAEGNIDLPYPIKLSKTVEERTGNMVQKVNEEGLPLYSKGVWDEELGQEPLIDPIESQEITDWDGVIYLETTESREVTEWEEITHTYRVVVGETLEESTDEEGNPILVSVHIYEEIHPVATYPKEWINYDPVMVPETLLRTYTFQENPYIFTREEVEQAKEQSIIDAQNAPPTEIEELQNDVSMLQGATDFIVMNF